MAALPLVSSPPAQENKVDVWFEMRGTKLNEKLVNGVRTLESTAGRFNICVSNPGGKDLICYFNIDGFLSTTVGLYKSKNQKHTIACFNHEGRLHYLAFDESYGKPRTITKGFGSIAIKIVEATLSTSASASQTTVSRGTSFARPADRPVPIDQKLCIMSGGDAGQAHYGSIKSIGAVVYGLTVFHYRPSAQIFDMLNPAPVPAPAPAPAPVRETAPKPTRAESRGEAAAPSIASGSLRASSDITVAGQVSAAARLGASRPSAATGVPAVTAVVTAVRPTSPLVPAPARVRVVVHGVTNGNRANGAELVLNLAPTDTLNKVRDMVQTMEDRTDAFVFLSTTSNYIIDQASESMTAVADVDSALRVITIKTRPPARSVPAPAPIAARPSSLAPAAQVVPSSQGAGPATSRKRSWPSDDFESDDEEAAPPMEDDERPPPLKKLPKLEFGRKVPAIGSRIGV